MIIMYISKRINAEIHLLMGGSSGFDNDGFVLDNNSGFLLGDGHSLYGSRSVGVGEGHSGSRNLSCVHLQKILQQKQTVI